MIGDNRQRVTIGHYPDMSLKEARTLALSVIANREAPPKGSTVAVPYLTSAAAALMRAPLSVRIGT